MLNARQILVSAIGLAMLGVGLAGCGQRGPLYLPTDPAAANRATLPQVLLPVPSRSESTPEPQTGAPASSAPAGDTEKQNNPTNTSR
ncbi:MAG TPA: lipoprotein [Variovorax sp.]|nr:lipoprotein [Variovorax sp.]